MNTTFTRVQAKNQNWPKDQPKISKSVSLRMKSSTETPTLAGSRKSSVFFSYDWYSVPKMIMY